MFEISILEIVKTQIFVQNKNPDILNQNYLCQYFCATILKIIVIFEISYLELTE